MIKQRLVSGRPVRVGEREIVPQARLTWLAHRRARLGTHSSAGTGWAVVRLEPVALIEQAAGHTRRIPIPNQTARLLLGLLAGAIVLPFLLDAAVRLARPPRNVEGD